MTLLKAAKRVLNVLGARQEVWMGFKKHKYEAIVDPDHDPIQALREAIERQATNYCPVCEAADSYAKFGRLVVENIAKQPHWWADEWSTEIMPLAVDAGLAERVQYDPAIHGENVEADPGDEIWVWTPEATR